MTTSLITDDTIAESAELQKVLDNLEHIESIYQKY
jgi:hypothetical protein